MAKANVEVPFRSVVQSSPRPAVPEWQIARLFFQLQLTYVGVQLSYGCLPEGDLVLFKSPSGSTLSVPIDIFSDLAAARMTILAKCALADHKELSGLPPLNPQEVSDLAAEAGRPFLSEHQAHVYRLAKTHRHAVERMLARKAEVL